MDSGSSTPSYITAVMRLSSYIVKTVLEPYNFMNTMLRIENKMEAGVPPSSTLKFTQPLKFFYKIPVMYNIWMGYRNVVVYAKLNGVAELTWSPS